jgi:hypothetical protein
VWNTKQEGGQVKDICHSIYCSHRSHREMDYLRKDTEWEGLWSDSSGEVENVDLCSCPVAQTQSVIKILMNGQCYLLITWSSAVLVRWKLGQDACCLLEVLPA